ncbi:hypothetical protein [Desulfogranum marinum]|uniref:hypothetical protein n=1 Tax=Desulfogranum marinum TaxID=453220 RepID=UPI001E39603F
MGQLWQTLILQKWNPLPAYLPVETVIRERQNAYYQVLAKSDQQGNATCFIEFMLRAIENTINEAVATDQVNDQVGAAEPLEAKKLPVLIS